MEKVSSTEEVEKKRMRTIKPSDSIMEYALNQVEKRMKQTVSGVLQNKLTGAVLKQALAVRGKMLRPQMLILSAFLVDEKRAADHMDELVRWASIIELSHTASLLHDDVIDNSFVRRGRATVMKLYGNSSAVYAGDYLLACILRVVLESHGEDKALLLTDGIEEMCIGEINQTRCKYQHKVSVEQYNENIAGKTGVLFAAACRLGAMEVTQQQEMIERYEQLGRKLGRAFQLRDDLLDLTSSTEEAGKMVMQDFREGIYTLPFLLARDHERFGTEVKKLMKKNQKGNLGESELKRLKEILIESRAIEEVTEEVNQILEECKSITAASSCQWAKERAGIMLDKLKIGGGNFEYTCLYQTGS